MFEGNDIGTAHFCTIITQNHIDKTLALLKSLRVYHNAIMHTLVINGAKSVLDKVSGLEVANGLRIYGPQYVSDGHNGLLARIMFSKYAKMHDELRWALKGPFISTLIEKHIPICYCDCDLFFYGDYRFIISKLRKRGGIVGKSILLTPHFREIRRIKDDEWIYNYRHGLYNAGFIGFGDGCADMLDWWSEMCAIECTVDDDSWTYVDQRYLDVVPIYFSDVEVMKHYGCNVAAWNTFYLKRQDSGGTIKINGHDVVFVHYSPITIKYINEGLDPLLYGLFNEYKSTINGIRKVLIDNDLRQCISGKLYNAELQRPI